jgi:hypothetical protein
MKGYVNMSEQEKNNFRQKLKDIQAKENSGEELSLDEIVFCAVNGLVSTDHDYFDMHSGKAVGEAELRPLYQGKLTEIENVDYNPDPNPDAGELLIEFLNNREDSFLKFELIDANSVANLRGDTDVTEMINSASDCDCCQPKMNIWLVRTGLVNQEKTSFNNAFSIVLKDDGTKETETLENSTFSKDMKSIQEFKPAKFCWILHETVTDSCIYVRNTDVIEFLSDHDSSYNHIHVLSSNSYQELLTSRRYIVKKYGWLIASDFDAQDLDVEVKKMEIEEELASVLNERDYIVERA